ncbi:MAG: tetratricopeptide repeat protein [Promethearchaeota archaeon]|jgi:tetratricopeptide (TPR) repeat protein
MDKQTLEEESEEFFRVKQLVIEGKHEEALQVINSFRTGGELSTRDNILYNLLECDILFQQGLPYDVITLAKKIYQECLGLGENLLTVDILLKIAETSVNLWDPTTAKEKINLGEELLNSLPQKNTVEFRQREAYISYTKGLFHAIIKNEAEAALEHIDHSIKLYEIYGTKIEVVKSLSVKAWVIGFLKGDNSHALNIAQNVLDIAQKSNYTISIALVSHHLAWFYWLNGDLDNSLKFCEQSIAKFKELNNKFFIPYVFDIMSFICLAKGDLDMALEYAEQGLNQAKENNVKRQIASSLRALGGLYAFKGEIDHSILLSEQALAIVENLDNKLGISSILNNMAESYRSIGELERALECINKSIGIHKDMGNLRSLANNYDYLIQILLDMGELGQAQKAIKKLEHMSKELNNKLISQIYLFDKALVLKTSSRARDRGKAEEILKQLIEQEEFDYELTVNSLLNLCELLLTELQITNDLEVLEEINTYTNQLLAIAENSHSFILFAETYFLKAKMALLTLDVKTARRFLTQAQRTAERFSLNQLATKISLEHNNLVDQLGMWEDLEKKDISLTERIKLVGLETHMKQVLQKSNILTIKISEEDVTVYRSRKICLVCKGEVLGFMYTCKCDAIYCENCARALTDLENICWFCNAVIDISKPSKPYKEGYIRDKSKKKN